LAGEGEGNFMGEGKKGLRDEGVKGLRGMKWMGIFQAFERGGSRI
jgi:hypothetical protein